MFQSVRRHQSVRLLLAWLEQRANRGQETRDRASGEEVTRAEGAAWTRLRSGTMSRSHSWVDFRDRGTIRAAFWREAGHFSQHQSRRQACEWRWFTHEVTPGSCRDRVRRMS